MMNQRLSDRGHSKLVTRISEVLNLKGWTARAWSLESTGKPDTIRNILRGGSNAPRADTLASLAKTAGCSVPWLMGETDEGVPQPSPAPATPNSDPLTVPLSLTAIQDIPRDFPIVGSGSCGDDGRFEFQGEVIDYTRRPPRLARARDAYALYVRGTSMEPWRKDGEFVFVHPHQPVKIGDYVVVQIKPEKPGEPMPAYIKQLIKSSDTEVRLLQFNPKTELTIRSNKIVSIHRIVDWSELFSL